MRQRRNCYPFIINGRYSSSVARPRAEVPRPRSPLSNEGLGSNPAAPAGRSYVGLDNPLMATCLKGRRPQRSSRSGSIFWIGSPKLRLHFTSRSVLFERSQRLSRPLAHSRTHEPPYEGQRFSRPPRSTAPGTARSILGTEGVGFEPTSPLTRANGFRDRPVQPLRHPSGGSSKPNPSEGRIRRERSRERNRI